MEGSREGRKKWLWTTTMFFTEFVSGIGIALMASARLQVADSMAADLTQVNYDMPVLATGSLLGATAAGLLFSAFDRQAIFILVVFSSAGLNASLPFVRSIVSYLSLQLIRGVTSSLTDIILNTWLLEVWEQEVHSFMQAMFFFSAAGQAVGPLIMRPFLPSNRTSLDSGVEARNETMTPGTDHHLVIPFTITACALVASAALLSFLYIRIPYLDPKRTFEAKKQTVIKDCSETNSTSLSDASPARGSAVAFVAVLLCALSLYVGLEVSTFNFLPEFAVLVDLRMSQSRVSLLTSVMFAAFAGVRFISIFVACKFSTRSMICASLCLILTGNLLLLMFANSSETMVWIAVVILGSGHASVYPCMWSFLEQRINVTNRMSALFSFTTTGLAVLLPIVVGSLIQGQALVFVYVNLSIVITCSCFSLAVFVMDARSVDH